MVNNTRSETRSLVLRVALVWFRGLLSCVACGLHYISGRMKRFDRQYFDKWYRHPAHAIGSSADLERQVHLAVAAAEYMLARPIRSVLDVGAGEGRWYPVLRRLRPSVRYQGVDPSEYTVQRYAARRNLMLGTLDDLDTMFPDAMFDLVVCCSVLNYLSRAELVRGLGQLFRRTKGVAFLELFTSEDDVVGDTDAWKVETPAGYRRLIRKAGFTPCGMHCYVTDALQGNVAALEQAS
jgi:SAM-dependent methyltransferase